MDILFFRSTVKILTPLNVLDIFMLRAMGEDGFPATA
jgi:hypothetical protein